MRNSDWGWVEALEIWYGVRWRGRGPDRGDRAETGDSEAELIEWISN
jgi:hypothetical protein